jgi:hypothetical protein
MRTKVCRRDLGWYVGLVYDPRELLGVMIARSRVAGCYNTVHSRGTEIQRENMHHEFI